MSDPPPVIPLPGTPEDRRAPQRRFRGETPEDRYRRRLDTKLRGVQHPDTCHREECAQHAIPDDGVSRDFYQTAIWRLAAGTLSEPDDPWHDRADPDGAARQVVSSDQYPLLAEHEGKVRALADYKPERKPKAKFPGWTGPEPETSGLVPLSRERVQEMALTFCTGDAARVTAEAFAEKFNSEIAPGLHCRPISVKTAELAIAEVKNTGRMFIDSPQGWHRHGQAWVYLPPKYGVIPDEVMGWVESLAASRAAGR